LLARCLRKDPKERLRDIGDGRIELREASRLDRPAEPMPAVVSRAAPLWSYGLLGVVAALALLAGVLAGRRTVDTRPPVFRPLTLNNGAVYSARFTPDGGTVIYGAAFDGHPLALFAARTDGLESRPIDVPGSDVAGISRNGAMALLIGRRYAGSWLRTGTL